MTAATASHWLRRAGLDLAYVLTGLPVAVVTFSVSVTLLASGLSLVVTLVGLPLLALTCLLARVFAAVERRRLGWLADAPVAAPAYRPRTRGGVGAMLDVARDPQAGRDLLHSLVMLPITCVTWSVAVGLAAMGLFALPWPLFGHALDDADDATTREVWQRLGVDSYAGRSATYAVVGAICLLLLPFVLRRLASLQAGVSRRLLAASPAAGR